MDKLDKFVDEKPQMISSLVIAAIFLVFLGFIFGIFTLIPAVICSIIAFFQYKNNPERQGKVLMYIILVISILFTLRILLMLF